MVELPIRRPAALRLVALVTATLVLLAAPGIVIPPGADTSLHVSAEGDPLTVFVRIEGPADASTFRNTGEYVTTWAGEVEVPREVTITAANGREYRLYVEDGTLKATRLDTNETRDLAPADDALGATSVLAALHAASLVGDFDYQVTDLFFPGQGFFVTSIGGDAGSGVVGWSYRVWNDEVAASPQVSVERFLLGYDSTGVALPHTQVLFYWGYASRCLPTRVAPLEDSVQCGHPLSVLVEAFVEQPGASGYWRPVEGASVCVGEECRITGDDGVAELVFAQPGTHYLHSAASYDGSYYYVPADGRTSVEVTEPCEVISFTVVDRGEQGIKFGYVVPGSADVAELGQTEEHGAVTLVVGEETTIDCVVELRASGGLAGDGSEIPLSGVTWAMDCSGAGAAAMPVEYSEIGPALAGEETTYNVWHWLSVPSDQPYGVYAGRFYYRVRSLDWQS
ncbi:MAG: hypothetical protein JXA58_05100 [Dehalococcoidia bacterium]|nr:hypothetical protein [Dehalococcoidia bacterium]